MEKITQEQKAKIYCIKNGHANYVDKCWGYVHCGRCNDLLGDQLGGIYNTVDKLVIGCEDTNCSICLPLKNKLNDIDKTIFERLSKGLSHSEAIKDIDFGE